MAPAAAPGHNKAMIMNERMRFQRGRTATRYALSTTAVLVLFSCVGLRVNTDFDAQASFTDLATYDWADSTEVVDEASGVSPFLERRVRRAVDLTLVERGFALDTVGEIDFIVTAFVVAPPGYEPATGTRTAVSFHFGVGIGYAYPYWYGHPGFGGYPYFGFPYFGARSVWGPTYGAGSAWFPLEGQPSSEPGTLVVDIFDGATGELIWRGWADSALLGMPSDQGAQEFLNKTVAKILERFPPRR